MYVCVGCVGMCPPFALSLSGWMTAFVSARPSLRFFLLRTGWLSPFPFALSHLLDARLFVCVCIPLPLAASSNSLDERLCVCVEPFLWLFPLTSWMNACVRVCVPLSLAASSDWMSLCVCVFPFPWLLPLTGWMSLCVCVCSPFPSCFLSLAG